jgi:hypothetical protein
MSGRPASCNTDSAPRLAGLRMACSISGALLRLNKLERSSSMRFTGASSLRRAARWHCRSSRTGPIKPRCSAANHNGVRVDLRVMDRGSRSHQIGSHQTADGARQFWRIVMLQRERPQGVRLGIEVEADALLSTSGCKPIRLRSNAPKRRAATKWRGTGASWRRRLPAGQAGAHPCSTPYSVDDRPRVDEGGNERAG